VGQATRAAGYLAAHRRERVSGRPRAADLRAFNSHRVSGLILRSAYGRGNYDYLGAWPSARYGVVEIDYFHPHSPFHHVMLDNASATAEGVATCADLGHERIAGVGLEESVTYHPDERTMASWRPCGGRAALPDAWNPKVAASGVGDVPEEHAYQATAAPCVRPGPPPSSR
jgi:LacI family transcriptional regulator